MQVTFNLYSPLPHIIFTIYCPFCMLVFTCSMAREGQVSPQQQFHGKYPSMLKIVWRKLLHILLVTSMFVFTSSLVLVSGVESVSMLFYTSHKVARSFPIKVVFHVLLSFISKFFFPRKKIINCEYKIGK